MNVYAKLCEIKQYELGELVRRLRELGGSYDFGEDCPRVSYYDRYAEPNHMYVQSVSLAHGCANIDVVGDNGDTATDDDLFAGEMTELLNNM